MIAAIQEAQRKLQEEEERLRKEAEAEEARLAALEAARLEAERLEQERKERKKKREKERKERLKAEGKLLTPKQRADRARAQAMLEALGVAPPPAGEKKFRPGTRIRPSKNKQQQQQATGTILLLVKLAFFIVHFSPYIYSINLSCNLFKLS
jgi:translation initiation factor 5B